MVPFDLCLCFNGAATLSLRKRVFALPVFVEFTALQWGRNFIVAETGPGHAGRRRPVRGFNGAATLSLRKQEREVYGRWLANWLQWGRNFIVAETCRRNGDGSSILAGFNGAAILSLRKRQPCKVQEPVQVVLQWGRNFIVAETGAGGGSLRRLVMLQWGRNFIVAETRDRGVPSHPRGPASMGPQLYRCGNSLSLLRRVGRRVASMGPQLYRCGNTKRTGMKAYGGPCFNGAATLSLRKRSSLIRRSAYFPWLQWGRNFIVAETS